MNLRLKFTLALAAALAAACAAAYFWGDAAALVVIFAAAAAFFAARQFNPEAGDTSRVGVHVSTAPNVAAAVAAGGGPAAALLEVTMDSMREAVVIIDRAVRALAQKNHAA